MSLKKVCVWARFHRSKLPRTEKSTFFFLLHEEVFRERNMSFWIRQERFWPASDAVNILQTYGKCLILQRYFERFGLEKHLNILGRMFLSNMGCWLRRGSQLFGQINTGPDSTTSISSTLQKI